MASTGLGRIAVVGATGPTGRQLASELVARGGAVRVVSRRRHSLDALFPAPGIEKRPGDAMHYESLAPALEGCDTVVDCIGLPGHRMAEHPATARNIARFVRESGARCLQVSSYWSYMPVTRAPVSETHPRAGGPSWARIRRETEDILRDAGAAIVHLPDFFGPGVHTSTLQLAIQEATKGNRIHWMGPAEVERDYIYVPDAMQIVAELLARQEAYGEDWVVSGAGPVSATQVAAMLGGVLGRDIKVRSVPPWMLKVMGVFSKELRGFLQVLPEYTKPITFNSSKLAKLLGPSVRTPYAQAFLATVAWTREVSGR